MARSSVIGALRVTLGLDSAEFEEGAGSIQRQAAQLERRFATMGKRMQGLGKSLSIGLTAPLAVFAKKSVDGAIAQQKAMADVEAALKSMGDVSGKTAQELLKTSDALELNSMYDGDQILKDVTANLLTFGNVADEQFDRAQQAALDMAARLGKGPREAAVQVGKALNDPIRGITALSDAGVQFTEKQRDTIKALVETGKTAEAQKIILGELEKQFKGAAKAAADADPWRKAQVQIGQSMDAIGEAILPAIKPITEAIVTIANAFNSLSPGMQKTVVIAGALAAALGPVLIGLGAIVSAISPFLGLITAIGASGGVMVAAKAATAGFAAAIGVLGKALLGLLANPIVLGAAAVIGGIYLAWKNWDKIKAIVDSVAAAVSEFWNANVAPVLGSLKAMLLAAAQWWADMRSGAGRAIVALGESVASWWSGTVQPVLDAVARKLAGAVQWWVGLQVGALRAIAALVAGVRDWIGNKLGAIWQGALDKIKAVERAFFWLYDQVVGNSHVPDMVDKIASTMARLDKAMVDPARAAARSTEDAFREMAGEVSALIDRLFPEAARLRDLYADMKLLDSELVDPAVRGEGRRRLLQDYYGDKPVVDAAKQGPVMDASVIRAQAQKIGDEMTKQAKRVEVANVRIVESFRDLTDRALGSLDQFVRGLKGGGVLDIVQGLLGALDSFGAIFTGGKGFNLFGAVFGKNPGGNVPGYANGGSFTFGGRPGVDRNLLSLNGTPIARVSRGEHATITPANSNGGASSGKLLVRMEKDGGLTAHLQGIAGRVVADAAPGLITAGGQAGVAQMMRRQNRSLG